MPFKPNPWVLSALLFIGVPSPSSAQTTVYKCESGGTVTYSEKPCRGRVINTGNAPVPAKPNPKEVDLRRIEENRVVAQAMQPRADESAEQFETRRRRARLMPADRDECARLDKRMPVEEASLTNPDPKEVAKAQQALDKSRKRFGELRC
jgi:hypothetical protein